MEFQKPERKQVTGFMITPSMKAKLDEIAQKHGVSTSLVVRQYLQRGIDGEVDTSTKGE